MNLRKIQTNSIKLNNLWVKNGIIEENNNLCKGSKFLDMIWNLFEDKIKLNFSSVLENVEKKNKGHTKQQILKIIVMIYDPIGFLASFIVKAKIILQEIWTLGTEWDKILQTEILTKWDSWCMEL